MLNLENIIVSLRNLLSQDPGLLFIEVPNCVQDYWRLVKNHEPFIHFFTEKSLVNIFRKFHFKCLKIGEFGNTWQEHFSGVKPNYGPKEEGCWIRALFQITEG